VRGNSKGTKGIEILDTKDRLSPSSVTEMSFKFLKGDFLSFKKRKNLRILRKKIRFCSPQLS